MADERFDLVVIGSGPGGYVGGHPGRPAGAEGGRRRGRPPRRHLPELGLHPHQGAPAQRRGRPALPARGRVRRHRRQPPGRLRGGHRRSRQVADRMAKGVEFLFRKNKIDLLRAAAPCRAGRRAGAGCRRRHPDARGPGDRRWPPGRGAEGPPGHGRSTASASSPPTRRSGWSSCPRRSWSSAPARSASSSPTSSPPTGSEVTIVEALPRLLPDRGRGDLDASWPGASPSGRSTLRTGGQGAGGAAAGETG